MLLPKFATALLLLTVLLAPQQRAFSGEIQGTADSVIDGDTLWVCDQVACHKIRLCGVNAPERKSAGGPEAKIALEALVEGQTIRCTPVGDGTVCDGRSKRTSYDRTVAQCFVNGTDLADELVATGHACDWVKFSGGHYSRESDRVVCRN
jgi:micrococcal nuclease